MAHDFDTYAKLQAKVADELHRSDLTSRIPGWIDLFEAEARRMIEGKDQKMFLQLTVSSNSTDLGSGVRNIVSAYHTGDTWKRVPLEVITPERLEHFRASLGPTGVPRYICVVNNDLLVAPTPDQDYDIEVLVEMELVDLTDTATSNWLLLLHPDAYLYGTLEHSAPFLRGDERIVLWDGLKKRAMEQIRVARDRAELGANTLTVKRKSALGSV